MTTHTKAVLSFALCGFANLSSIAILLGGLGSIAPSRRHDIARFGIRAVLAGTLSNLMSATLAGFFIAWRLSHNFQGATAPPRDTLSRSPSVMDIGVSAVSPSYI